MKTGWAGTKYKDNGSSITIPLSNYTTDPKYHDYSILCLYKYNWKTQKFRLSLYIDRDNPDNSISLTMSLIDTQYITGTYATIQENIFRIVRYFFESGKLDTYLDWYEYDIACCKEGAEQFEHQESS